MEQEKYKSKITLGRVILIALIIFVLFSIFVWYPMYNLDILRCSERYNELNISRCDILKPVPTINPFKYSTKCYCENYDRVYFDLENKNG